MYTIYYSPGPTHTIMSHGCLSLCLPCLMSRTKLSVLRPQGSPASPPLLCACRPATQLTGHTLARLFVCVAGWLTDWRHVASATNIHFCIDAVRCDAMHIHMSHFSARHGMHCIERTDGRTNLVVHRPLVPSGLLVASCHNAYFTPTHTSHA